MPPAARRTRRYIGQALKALVMHEIGHTLGLRHNFRGSAGVTKAQLADRVHQGARPRRVGDGLQPAGALARSRAQGDYYAATVGTYDRWAIRYGYTAWARASRRRPEAKGSAEEAPVWTPDVESMRSGPCARSGRARPPVRDRRGRRLRRLGPGSDCLRYDQTDDPLGWARDRVALINGLFDSLETRMVAPGQGYARLAPRSPIC